MCAYCSPYVSIENIGTEIPSSSAIGIDVTSVLLADMDAIAAPCRARDEKLTGLYLVPKSCVIG